MRRDSKLAVAARWAAALAALAGLGCSSDGDPSSGAPADGGALADASVPIDPATGGSGGGVAAGGTGGALICTGGQVPCGGSCVDPNANNLHCGMCFQACPPGSLCTSGTCECQGELEACPTGCTDLSVDPSNCGACGTVCDPVAQTCTAGACSCRSGLTACGADCVDVASDPAHCGGCHAPCAAGEVCSLGACSVDCAPGLAQCGLSCVDTSQNPLHCGTCNVECLAAQSCQSGICTCPSGQTACGTECVDTSSSNLHCGVCGNVCSGGRSCQGGLCLCSGGLTECDGLCVDISTDALHCGACNNACPEGQCVGGQCQSGTGGTGGGETGGTGGTDTGGTGGGDTGGTGGGDTGGTGGTSTLCTGGLIECDGECFDPSTDPLHCGGCDVQCAGGRECLSGLCECPSGGTFCGGACVDTLTSAAHCGGCNQPCASPRTCVSGACQCDGGLVYCNGACVDTQTDPDNCGTCSNRCAAGVCNAGTCPVVKDCAVSTLITSPLIADFEAYDGVTPPAEWGFAFNAAAGEPDAVYAGPYEYNDGTGTPTLAMTSGNASTYGVGVSNSLASEWGGALGFWMSCIDASAYRGISFWVRGSAPSGSVSLTLAMEDTSAPDATNSAAGGTCLSDCSAPTLEIAVTTGWSQVLASWSAFTPGTANGASVPATGGNITGLTFSVPLQWIEDPSSPGDWIPSPSAYEFVVDDLRFIDDSSCDAGQTLCGTACVDTATSDAHCGRCNNACVNSQTCVSGACVCPTGYAECSGECVDTRIDVQNCGACGNQCSGTCSAGVCTNSSCTSGMPQVGRTCTAYDSITLGKYWINNNVWGASGATGTQCIWRTCLSGNTIGWGTDWTWSGASSQVKSYASAVLGWHWGWEVDRALTGLPIRISDNRNVTCSWTYRVGGSGTINVSYDLWTHSIASPDWQDDPNEEIMIWLYRSGGAGPIGSLQTTVSLAGTSWDLYRGSNGYWNVFSFIRTANTSSATLNLRDFLGDLVSRGWLSSTRYLSSIQAGTEVFLGTGQLDTDAYSCVID